MTTFANIKAAFLAFTKAAVPGQSVNWTGANRDFEFKLPSRVELEISAISGVGIDVAHYSDTGLGEVSGDVEAHRIATCTFRVHSRDYVNAQAELVLERVRVAFKKPTTYRILRDAGIGISTVGPTVAYPVMFQERQESVAAFQLRFLFLFTDESTLDGPVGTLEQVAASSDIDPSSQAEWQDHLIPTSIA